MPHPTNREYKENFSMMMGFGKSNVPFQSNVAEFDRLPIQKISDSDNQIAAARLTPSANNSQPWKLHFENGKVTVTYYGREAFQLIFKRKFSRVDLEIITKHIELAILYEYKKILSIVPKNEGKSFFVEINYK
jgi:hypothetical protein